MAEKSNWTAERVFREYHDRVLRYIRAKVSFPQKAEDICSSVFLKVQSSISRYDPEKLSFLTWIYAITLEKLPQRECDLIFCTITAACSLKKLP